MTSSRVAFLVLHFRDSTMTRRCLESVAAAARSEDGVYVIDNSWDYEADDAFSSFPVIVPAILNPGFSTAMNVGADRARRDGFDVYTFVNNDTVLPSDFLAGTLPLLGEGSPPAAAVGPKIVFLERPDRVWSAGGRLSPLLVRGIQTAHKASAESVRGSRTVEFLSGCVVTVLGEAFHRAGGWPEAYYFGGEEWELSRTLRRLGYSLVVAGDVGVLHDAHWTSGQGSSHDFTDIRFVLNSYLNRLVFAHRNFSPLRARAFRVLLVAYVLLVMPFRWKRVGPARDLPGKLRLSGRMAALLARRPGHRAVTREELDAFSAALRGN